MKIKIIISTFTLFVITGTSSAQNYNLLIGTYTNKGNSEGIYVYNFNASTAETELKNVAKNIVNPSYLAVSADKKFVYSVNENGTSSEVSAFSFNTVNGEMKFINKNDAKGADPCFISVDKKNIFLANYTGGNVVVYGLNKDGSIGKLKQVISHLSRSIYAKTVPHLHQIQFTPDRKYLISNDLGNDQINLYQYHPNSSNKPLVQTSIFTTDKNSGPRHLAFSPNGNFAYLAHEFTGKITALRYANGKLNKIEDVATIPSNFKGKIDGADIHVSADGKFLYETNRGDANAISIFSIANDGKLTLIETVSTLGKGPRNFAIDPTGKFVLVAHQYTNDVVIFNRNTTTGKLTDSGKRINVGAPVCLVFN